MTHNEKGPTSAPTLNRAGSINPTKDQKMNEHGYNTDAACAPALTRRKLLSALAAASTAATLPAVALAEASGKTSRLPLPLDRQLEECVARLREILAEMHPNATKLHHYLGRYDDGSFRFSLQGDVKFGPFQGAGIYLVSVAGCIGEYLVREEPVVTLAGRSLGYSHYWGRVRLDDGEWADDERWMSNFIRKIGEVPA
ncbi:hypothetical protein [Neorhizobium huautlense]|uniref:hypothetical protein n=1 Tax=Neorhizobium huautlense TaxID=67774 RepID=UPI000CF8F63E|nr:hypothetical protein [Neorhizobium huautlense]